MKKRVQGIVLRNPVRHSDRADILTVYSPEHGRLSVVVPAGGGATVRHRKAAFMPLSVIEFMMPENIIGRLPHASSFTLVFSYKSLYFNPLKSAIGMMLAEFLNRLLRDSSPDSLMYSYIVNSMRLLDDIKDEKWLANFHIAFLTGIASFAGITPDVSDYSEGALFDLVAGRYSKILPPHNHILMGDDAKIPHLLSRMNFANQRLFKFTRQQRRDLIEGILRYFGLHFPGTDNLNSLEILYTLFD